MEEIECPYCGNKATLIDSVGNWVTYDFMLPPVLEVTEAIYKCECGKILICDENGSIKD